MRYPGRGRKLCILCIIIHLSKNNWEMRYPGRGRKRIPVLFESTQLPLRNEIPRKGTETEEKRMLNKAELQLRNEIPRKGTETKKHFVKRTKGGYIEKWDTPEGDGNITEYDIVSANIIEKWDTPEGDGNDSHVTSPPHWAVLRNEIPRKGTETRLRVRSHYLKWLRNEIPRKGTETLVGILFH